MMKAAQAPGVGGMPISGNNPGSPSHMHGGKEQKLKTLNFLHKTFCVFSLKIWFFY